MRNNITQTTRQVTDTHWLIIDVNDARHEITDISRLIHAVRSCWSVSSV